MAYSIGEAATIFDLIVAFLFMLASITDYFAECKKYAEKGLDYFNNAKDIIEVLIDALSVRVDVLEDLDKIKNFKTQLVQLTDFGSCTRFRRVHIAPRLPFRQSCCR